MHKLEDSVLKQKGMKKGITEEIATRKRALNFYSLANILPDPDIVLKKQGKDIRIYKELLCDPHVFACIQSRKAGVLSLEWEINRGLDKAKDAELVEDLLKKLDIHKYRHYFCFYNDSLFQVLKLSFYFPLPFMLKSNSYWLRLLFLHLLILLIMLFQVLVFVNYYLLNLQDYWISLLIHFHLIMLNHLN